MVDENDLTGAIHEVTSRFDALRRRIGELEAEKADLAQALARANEDLAGARRQLAATEEGHVGLSRALGEATVEVENLRHREAELAEANRRLTEALGDAGGRIEQLEQILANAAQLGSFASSEAAQTLDRAARKAERVRDSWREAYASGRLRARERALSLVAEAFLLIEGTRDGGDRPGRESEDQVIEILKRSRDSLLTVAANLERVGREVRPGEEATAEEAGPAPEQVEAEAELPPAPVEVAIGAPTATPSEEPVLEVVGNGALDLVSAPAEETVLVMDGEGIPDPVSPMPLEPVPVMDDDGPSDQVSAVAEELTPEHRGDYYLQLVASPLRDGTAASAFRTLVERASGVSSVTQLEHSDGILRLGVVSHGSVESLLSHLGSPGAAVRVVALAPGVVEIAVSEVGIGAEPRGSTRHR